MTTEMVKEIVKRIWERLKKRKESQKEKGGGAVREQIRKMLGLGGKLVVMYL